MWHISSQWLSVHVMLSIIAVLAYVTASHMLRQRRHPSAAIGWVLFMLLLPYAALPLYLLFGTRKLGRARGVRPSPHGVVRDDNVNTWAMQVARALGQPNPATYRHLRIHDDGAEALRALLEVIDGAQHTVDVCTFIVGRDALGHTVARHLANRARAGVRVRLLVDGVGRMLGGWLDFAPLTRAGVRIGVFVPPLHSPLKGRTNLRNHRKVVVADAGGAGERLWSGGRNLAAEYFEGDAARPAWRDLSFDLQGSLARQAAELFQRGWVFAVGPQAPASSAEGVAPLPRSGCDEPSAQLIASGPDQPDDTIHALLVSAAYRAHTRVMLVSPYVVLDEALLMALTLAARRGVRVDVLLPERSNHRLADIARSRSLRALANAGVNVWLAPFMLHAKAAIVDETLALVGTANLDGRSLFLNYELMVAFHDAGDIGRFAKWVERERISARPYVAHAPGLLRDIGEGLVLWIGFQL